MLSAIQEYFKANQTYFDNITLYTKPIPNASVPSHYVSLNYKKHCTLRYLVFRIHIGDPRLSNAPLIIHNVDK